MRVLTDKWIACLATIVIVLTPWRACNAYESSRSGRWEVAAAGWFLGGESASIGTVKATEDDWFLYGINVGMNINEYLNLNTEVVYGSIDVGVSGLPVGTSISGDQDTLVWLVNLDYNIFAERLTPYITGGIGLGYSDATVRFTSPTISGSVSDDESGFAYTAGGGVRWDVTETVFAKVAYRVLWDDEGEHRDGVGASVGFLFK